MKLNLQEMFEKYEGAFLKYDEIKNPPSRRSDLCAFLLLDKLLPGDNDIIYGAQHDIVFIGVNTDKLAEVATEEDIIYLLRCGVCYDDESRDLYMDK